MAIKFEQAKQLGIHDASGVINPYEYLWEQINGIYYPTVLVEQYFVRDLTGRGYTNTIYGRDELIEFFNACESEFSEVDDGDFESLADMYVGERITTTTIEITRIK